MADTTHMARRAVLKGALGASAFAATAGAAMALAPVDTPIKAIWRRYDAAILRLQAHNAALRADGVWERARTTDDDLLVMELQRAVREEPITSVEDLALKVMVATGYVSGPEWALSGECQTFLRGL